MNKDTSRADIKLLRGQDQKPAGVQNDLFASSPIDYAIVPHAEDTTRHPRYLAFT